MNSIMPSLHQLERWRDRASLSTDLSSSRLGIPLRLSRRSCRLRGILEVADGILGLRIDGRMGMG
jgi:hypothetical protein